MCNELDDELNPAWLCNMALVTIGEGVHHLLEEMQKQPRPPVIHTLDQRARVFVSSTLDELAPERQAAREAIAGVAFVSLAALMRARRYAPPRVKAKPSGCSAALRSLDTRVVHWTRPHGR
jgi:hypothetical protein